MLVMASQSGHCTAGAEAGARKSKVQREQASSTCGSVEGSEAAGAARGSVGSGAGASARTI